MTERLQPELEYEEAKKIAMEYLKSGTELSENTGLRNLLGLEDDLGPLFFSACAQKMIDYDLQENIKKLQRKTKPNSKNSITARLFNSIGKIEREILILGLAAEVLSQADELYIDGMFDPSNIPIQVPIIPETVHELFVILTYQTTTPQQTLTTRERVENWGASWRARLNPISTPEM